VTYVPRATTGGLAARHGIFADSARRCLAAALVSDALHLQRGFSPRAPPSAEYVQSKVCCTHRAPLVYPVRAEQEELLIPP